MFFVLLCALGSYFWIATDLILGDKKASIFDYNQTLVAQASGEISRILTSYEETLSLYFKSRAHPVVEGFVRDEILRQKTVIGVFVSEKGAGFESDITQLSQWELSRGARVSEDGSGKEITPQSLSAAFAAYVEKHKAELSEVGDLHVIHLSPVFERMVMGIAKFWRTTQGTLFGALFFEGTELYKTLISQSEFLATLVDREGNILIHRDVQNIFEQLKSPLLKHIEVMTREKIDAQTLQVPGASKQEEYLVSLVGIPRTQIMLTHEIPLKMAYLPIEKLRGRSVYFVIIALLLGVLLALIFSKTITAPIQSLAEVAAKVKQGIYKVSLRRSKASDEIGLLNQSFIEMTQELERRRIAIEKEIFNLKMVHESSKEISLERVANALIPLVLQRVVELLPLEGMSITYRHRDGTVLTDHVGDVPLGIHETFSRMSYTGKHTLFDPADQEILSQFDFLTQYVTRSGGNPFLPMQDRVALLVAGEECIGFIVLRKNVKEGRFSPQDEYMLGAIATNISITLKNIELIEETADKARLDNELKTAQLVQQTLLPKDVPDFDRVKLSGYYQPATECGGDWWGYFKLGETLVVMIADATGHGAGAALITAAARSAVSTISYYLQGHEHEFSPAEFLKTLNHALYETTQGSIYMTFFCAAIHMPSGRLRYSNAGHDFPWIYHGGKAKGQLPSKKFVESLVMKGHHVGKQADVTFEENETHLEPGDKLLLFTDGIPELLNDNGDEYGSKRFLNSFVQNAHLSSVELKDHIIGEATAFSKDAPLADDLTLVVVEYNA